MMMMTNRKEGSPFSQLHNAEQLSMPDAINVTPENPLLELFKFVAGFSGIVLVLYAICMYGVAALVPFIPPKDEGIFSPIALEFLKGKKTNPDLEKALQPDFETLLRSVPEVYRKELPLKLHVMDEDQLNAFAIPGGHIVTYTGLLNTFTGRDERLFVLAHEVGHFAKRHHLKKLGQGLSVYLLLMPINIFTPEVGKAFGRFVELDMVKHSQAQELEADLFALETMQTMHLDLMAPVRVFKQFRIANPDEDNHKWEASHPTSIERIEQVRAYLVAHPTVGETKQ
ncbi:MAG: M48 family metallopeptidase [Candidatus Melainabacteria bacterium]|nr:M48 family metallopeptidase [Candidatus Melainabacteria bacterium]